MKAFVSICLFSLILINCGSLITLKGTGLTQPATFSSKVDGKEFTVILPDATWRDRVSGGELSKFDIRTAILDITGPAQGDGIINLKFKVYQDFLQGCFASLGIYSYTVEIKGDVIKFK